MIYYIFHTPSMQGMGSDTDTFLITEDNLHGLMSEEEISDKLINCHTYESVPDLIRLPDSVTIRKSEIEMNNIIFRVHNQFMYMRDIIAKRALFTRYFVDLSDIDMTLGRWFREKSVYEFMDFDLKSVAENHFFADYKAKDLIEQEKHRLERMKEYPDVVYEAQEIIKRFEDLPDLKDEYYDHFYHQKDGWFPEDLIADEIAGDDVDHTKCAYILPLLPDTFGCVIKEPEDTCRYLRYDELFNRGTDVKYLMASLIGRANSEHPQIDMALRTIFAYD